MASNEQQAAEIQARMATLRDHMDVSVERTAAGARRWTDWRHYVKRFPLATTAVVAGVGYLLVPRRPKVVVPDPKQIAEMVKHEQLVVSQKPKRAKASSVAQAALGIVAAAAARAAMSYVGDQLTSGATARSQKTPAGGNDGSGEAVEAAPARAPRHPR